MTVLILVILAIAAIIYFINDFPIWYEKGLKFINEYEFKLPNFRLKFWERWTKEKVYNQDYRKSDTDTHIHDSYGYVRDDDFYKQNRAPRFDEAMRQAQTNQMYNTNRISNRQASAAEIIKNEYNHILSGSSNIPIIKSIPGEKISDWERSFLWNGIKNNQKVPCINCMSNNMYKAYDGKPSQIWHCESCGQDISIAFTAGDAINFKCVNLGINKFK